MFTISLYWQSKVVVKSPLHSDYILVLIIGKHDITNFVLNEDLGQQRDSSPTLKIMCFVRQEDFINLPQG